MTSSMPIAIQLAFAAPQVGHDGGRAGRPAGPQVGEVGHEREHQAPVPPEPAEAGQRGLAGGQRVALDLHVDEELGHQPDQRRPHEDQAHLGGDVGVEDELAAGQADTGGDDARADQLEPVGPGIRAGRRSAADQGACWGTGPRRCWPWRRW